MHSFLEIYKNSTTLHHAYYFIEHKVGEAVEKLKEFLEKNLGVRVSGNPDFFHKKYETFTIEDARLISLSESRKDFGGDKKIFIVETDFITEEAQNALLKAFEEPRNGTHFFIVSSQDILLPTLRSRLSVWDSRIVKEVQDESIFSKSLQKRLMLVKEITDAIKDEEMTKQDAINFVNKVERELYEKGVENVSHELSLCTLARNFLYARGAPVKIILENLMLSI